MVTIVERPRWTLWKHRQIYRCEVPGHCASPLELAAKFFDQSFKDSATSDGEGIRFSRGRIWGIITGWSERTWKQEVSVRLENGSFGRSLICDYRYSGPALMHMPPWPLHKEVQQLEAFLGGVQLPQTRRRGSFALTLALRILYRIYRILSTTQYWMRKRLTWSGWLVLGSLSGAMMMGLDTDNTVAYQGIPILLSVLALAVVFSWFYRTRFAVTRELPRFGTAGNPLHYCVKARNLTSKVQQGLTVLENLADPRPSFPEWRAQQIAEHRKVRSFRFSQYRPPNPFHVATLKNAELPAAQPGEEVEARVQVVPLRRGVLRFTALTLARTDPFGLFRSFVKIKLPQTVLILPRRYPLPPIELPGTMRYQEGGVALASNIGRSDEFVSLRDYRRGDPYRHIHWRSWAKAGKPIVKEFEDEFFVRHALVLDTFIDDPGSEAFEEAVSVAASFACSLPTQESLLDLLFVGAQAYCFTAGRGLADADQILEVLASVRTSDAAAFEKLEHLVFEHTGAVSGCICVLLAWDEQRRRLVEKLNILGMPLLVLVLVEAGQGRSLDPGPMRDRPEQFHVLEVGKVELGLAAL